MASSLLLAAFCCAAISFTVTVTSIFSGLRELLSKIHPKIEELVFCPWCFNHYVVIVFLLTSEVRLVNVSNWTVYNFLFTVFVLVGLGGIIHYVLLRAYEPIHKALMQRRLDKLKNHSE